MKCFFKLHLEKADYNKAVDDIKNIFNQLRKQSQKIQETALSNKKKCFVIFCRGLQTDYGRKYKYCCRHTCEI